MQASTASKSAPGSRHRGTRKLLRVYIHGFMGGGTNFRIFPAQVHNFVLSIVLEDLGWGAYAEVYPNFKTNNGCGTAWALYRRILAAGVA
ncbi:unnamed protein product, partial [Tuber aestivum]